MSTSKKTQSDDKKEERSKAVSKTDKGKTQSAKEASSKTKDKSVKKVSEKAETSKTGKKEVKSKVSQTKATKEEKEIKETKTTAKTTKLKATTKKTQTSKTIPTTYVVGIFHLLFCNFMRNSFPLFQRPQSHRLFMSANSEKPTSRSFHKILSGRPLSIIMIIIGNITKINLFSYFNPVISMITSRDNHTGNISFCTQ